MFSADTRRLQRIAVEESRLRIPLLFSFDVVHGWRTVFPVPIAAAGKSEDGETTIPSDETKPELSEEPPTRVTFMMNPSVSADNIDSFKIWGFDFSQLMGEAAS